MFDTGIWVNNYESSFNWMKNRNETIQKNKGWNFFVQAWSLKVFFLNLKSSLMSQLSLSASFEYLCYGSIAIIMFSIMQRGDRLYTSEPDVYRWQIQTSKGGTALKGLRSFQYFPWFNLPWTAELHVNVCYFAIVQSYCYCEIVQEISDIYAYYLPRYTTVNMAPELTFIIFWVK